MLQTRNEKYEQFSSIIKTKLIENNINNLLVTERSQIMQIILSEAKHIDSRSFLKFSCYLRKPISGKSREIAIFYIFNHFIVVSVESKVADSEFFMAMGS